MYPTMEVATLSTRVMFFMFGYFLHALHDHSFTYFAGQPTIAARYIKYRDLAYEYSATSFLKTPLYQPKSTFHSANPASRAISTRIKYFMLLSVIQCKQMNSYISTDEKNSLTIAKVYIDKNKFISTKQMNNLHTTPSNQGKPYSSCKKNESINIDIIKKNLLHDALSYNLQEEEIKSNNKRRAKQDEVETFTKINRRVSTELQHEKEVERERKLRMRKLLAEEYEKQIEEKRKVHVQEVRANRSYAQIEEENQSRLDQRRAREIARMYGRQRFNSSYNPECCTSQKPQIHGVEDRVYTQQIEEKQPLSYKEYLEQEIQRRRLKKEKEKSLQRQRQMQFISKEAVEREKQQEEHKNSMKRQRENFKRGLDDQIAYRKNIYHY